MIIFGIITKIRIYWFSFGLINNNSLLQLLKKKVKQKIRYHSMVIKQNFKVFKRFYRQLSVNWKK